MRLLSSIFPEKLIFEENKCRTPKINEAVRLLLATDKGFNEKGTTQIFKNLELSPWVELRGELSNLFFADLELLVPEKSREVHNLVHQDLNLQ
jgi:hypothetical protein